MSDPWPSPYLEWRPSPRAAVGDLHVFIERIAGSALLVCALLAGCTDPAATPASADDTATGPVPWTGTQAETATELDSVRGYLPRRGIIHLHSPWSHDACDGDPMPDGSPDQDCLSDLRHGLCATAMDFAYVTDHPAHAAAQTWADIFHGRAGDERVYDGDQPIANRIFCEDSSGNAGHSVLWLPGIEDELMPVGLERHVADSPEENDRVYNESDEEAVTSEIAAGGIVLQAHTEGKAYTDLVDRVGWGMQGVEIFNLHAMFDPSIRVEDLGLDQMGWALDIAPFTDEAGTAEPDLLFLAVLDEQSPSIQSWDALQSLAPVVGVGGTDAHQNVLPFDLRDGERADSYRRMMRWFANTLLVEGTDPADYDAALRAGRAYLAFEVLGTPAGFDFAFEDAAGGIHEMGSTVTGDGTLVVACPTLSPSSPRGQAAPEISVTIFKDGEPWATDCGSHDIDGAGVYRTRVDMVPWHLAEFLGDDPDMWMTTVPWVYSNAIRVQSPS